jgi:hypothetical protein
MNYILRTKHEKSLNMSLPFIISKLEDQKAAVRNYRSPKSEQYLLIDISNSSIEENSGLYLLHNKYRLFTVTLPTKAYV